VSAGKGTELDRLRRRVAELEKKLAARQAADVQKLHSAFETERLTAANRALERRIQEFTTLLALTPIGLAVAQDAECRRVVASPALTSMLGQSPEAPAKFFRDGREMTIDELPMQIAAREGIVVRGAEIEVHRTGARNLTLLAYADPLFDDNGRPRGCVAAFVDITERKQGERELAELSHRLQVHLENTPLAVIEFTPELCILRWSGDAERIFGWTAAEATGRKLSDLRWVHEEDAASVARLMEGMNSGRLRRPFSSNRNYTKDGRVLDIDWYNSTVLDSEGRLLSVLSFGLDVTARKRAESALRLSEARFRAALQNAPISVFNQDLDLRYTWIHNSFFGLQTEEILGKNDYDLLRHDDAGRVVEIKRRAIAENRGVRQEVSIHKDGEEHWFNLTVEPLRDATGSVSGITCAAIEISERRRMENALRDSEQRWRILTQAMPVLVLTSLPDGSCSYANTRWLDYTGQPIEQTYGRGWMDVLHTEDLETVRKEWKTALEKGEPFELQHRIRRASDGEYRWHLARTWPLRDEDDRIVQWLGTATDVHDGKMLQQELAVSNEELHRANLGLEEFAYAAAHDLQEPLRTLALYTQLLTRRYGPGLDETACGYLEVLLNSSRRMQDLVSDLLAYTRLSQSAEKGETAADCEDILQGVLEHLQTTISENAASVRSAGLPCVRAHGPRLAQLLQNLISNAIKYRRPDVAPEVRLLAERNGKFWTFSVCDNGIGISPEYHERIFGIFKRLHGKDIPGTGIGLAICRRIVELYGGRIWVESEGANRGSTFRFTLPSLEA
jgi:PAS domain S-box-containing protein